MSTSPVKKGDILKIYVDGASRGNPGPAASVFLFVNDGTIIHDECVFIGTATNNTAEYRAIINALKAITKRFSGYMDVNGYKYTAHPVLEVKDALSMVGLG